MNRVWKKLKEFPLPQNEKLIFIVKYKDKYYCTFGRKEEYEIVYWDYITGEK